MKNIQKFFAVFALSLASSGAFAQATVSADMGKGLFSQDGANSCQYCHGISGEGGKIAVAANLKHPKKWKVFAALGGEAAYKKDKAGFLKNMQEATMDLIMKGAVAHNATFKKPYFDWKKTQSYNAQMLGLTGAPSSAWLSKYKEKGVTKEIAAESAYLYVQSFDNDGVFK